MLGVLNCRFAFLAGRLNNPGEGCVADTNALLEYYRINTNIGELIGYMIVYLCVLHVITFVALLYSGRRLRSSLWDNYKVRRGWAINVYVRNSSVVSAQAWATQTSTQLVFVEVSVVDFLKLFPKHTAIINQHMHDASVFLTECFVSCAEHIWCAMMSSLSFDVHTTTPQKKEEVRCHTQPRKVQRCLSHLATSVSSICQSVLCDDVQHRSTVMYRSKASYHE